MSYYEVSINGGSPVPCEFRFETEQIDVSMETETSPDPRWDCVDQQGHYHAWTADGRLPTLTSRAEHRPCDGVHHFPVSEPCEGYDVTLWSCSLCGEDIEPGTVTRHGVKRTMSGMVSWTVVAYEAVPGRDPVSIRVDAGTETLFGFAVPTDLMVVESGAAELRKARTTLVGTSELGRRPVAVPA